MTTVSVKLFFFSRKHKALMGADRPQAEAQSHSSGIVLIIPWQILPSNDLASFVVQVPKQT